MKITKRQLRRIIREAYNSMSPRSKSLANAAKRQFAKDYPDVKVGIDGREGWITVDDKKAVNMSQASGKPLAIEDIIDQMKQAYLGHDMLSQEVPELTGGRKSSWQARKEKELGESKMKITKRQLRKLIRESLQIKEGTLYVTRTPYGMSVEDDNDEYINMGEMVKTLLDAGDDNIFRGSQGVDQEALSSLMSQHEKGVQGGMERWDSDVLRDYYNVDLDVVLKLYASKMNHNIEEVESEDY